MSISNGSGRNSIASGIYCDLLKGFSQWSTLIAIRNTFDAVNACCSASWQTKINSFPFCLDDELSRNAEGIVDSTSSGWLLCLNI